MIVPLLVVVTWKGVCPLLLQGDGIVPLPVDGQVDSKGLCRWAFVPS